MDVTLGTVVISNVGVTEHRVYYKEGSREQSLSDEAWERRSRRDREQGYWRSLRIRNNSLKKLIWLLKVIHNNFVSVTCIEKPLLVEICLKLLNEYEFGCSIATAYDYANALRSVAVACGL